MEDVISISTVGEALLALEREDTALADEMERLMARFRLAHKKRKVIHEATTRLLTQAGVAVVAKDWPKYPELNHEG